MAPEMWQASEDAFFNPLSLVHAYRRKDGSVKLVFMSTEMRLKADRLDDGSLTNRQFVKLSSSLTAVSPFAEAIWARIQSLGANITDQKASA